MSEIKTKGDDGNFYTVIKKSNVVLITKPRGAVTKRTTFTYTLSSGEPVSSFNEGEIDQYFTVSLKDIEVTLTIL